MCELSCPCGAEERSMPPEKLLDLLAHQLALYTANESGSVPRAMAEELLEGILYCLALCPVTDAESAAALEQGQRQARRLAAETCRLWCSVCHAPTWGSLSLHDTLRSIGRGFRQYDVRFFAHRFPCEIDYQPAIPVSETQKGLSYVNLYLRRPAAGRCGISCALCPRDRCAGRSAAGLRRAAGTICLTRRVLTSSSRSLRGRQETTRHSLRRR